ncbi:MAG TPA: right-handed parallel beta-helix repeat-containing protein [Allosphingosinicella sp.]
MKSFIKLCLALFVAAMATYATSASAQASRTWVSGVGDDVNPCSRTAPCKTFAGAISKTAAGGEINCLDPGGFGGVTITKSLTIDCTGTLGGILASSTTGVLVNGAGVHVVLRGLTINGGPPNITGLHGVRFLQGASLSLEHVNISNFNSVSAGAGNGITFTPSTAAELQLNDVTIVNCGSSGTTAGVFVSPTGAGTAAGTLDNVRLLNNTGIGLFVSGASTIVLVNSNVSQNTNFGLRTSGGAPLVRVGNSTIVGNGTGVSPAAGAIASYGTNRVNSNTTDGVFSGAVVPQQ